MTGPGVGDLSPVPSNEGAVLPASGSLVGSNNWHAADWAEHWKARAWALERERDEWQEQHENLLTVKRDDNDNLAARIRKLEADRDTYGRQFMEELENNRLLTEDRDQWRSKAKEAMERVHHDLYCQKNTRREQDLPCTCGLDALRKAISDDRR